MSDAARAAVGHVDRCSEHDVSGWAFLPDTPDKPATVEILVDGRPIGTALADQFRKDLRLAGIGSGRHAFTFLLPNWLADGADHRLSVRVLGAEQELPGGGQLVHVRRRLALVQTDITDNCNLRCPFCVYDYTGVNRTNQMTLETYGRVLELLPLVAEGGFHLSCLHEPTLHDRFAEFLDLLPAQYRSKVFFTTNLTKRLSDELLAAYSRANVDHINISYDTNDPEKFAVLRKGGKLTPFQRNLDRVIAAFAAAAAPPKLRYITMAYKMNLAEIPDLVRRCLEEGRADHHEVRYTFNVEHIDRQFAAEQFLDDDDWDWLEAQLAGMPGNVAVTRPPADYDPQRPVRLATSDPERRLKPLPSVRVSWDGLMRLRGQEKHFAVNLHAIRNLEGFLAAL